MILSYTDVPPSKAYGPRIKLTWTKPVTPNGIIRSYILFYTHSGDALKEISKIDALNYTVDVLGGVVYELYVRAVTFKPGPNRTINLTTREYGTFDSIYNKILVKLSCAWLLSWCSHFWAAFRRFECVSLLFVRQRGRLIMQHHKQDVFRFMCSLDFYSFAVIDVLWGGVCGSHFRYCTRIVLESQLREHTSHQITCIQVIWECSGKAGGFRSLSRFCCY